MHPRKCLPHIILTALLLLVSQFIAALPAGKIAGTVTDYLTGDPVAGVAVLIDGTTSGAKTDENGNFTIHNVSPGTYKLNVSVVGWGTVVVEGVEVFADSTAEISIQMRKTALESGKVISLTGQKEEDESSKNGTVSGKADLKNQSSSVTPVEKPHNVQVPSNTVFDTEARIRGGRTGQSKKIIDGVEYRKDRKREVQYNGFNGIVACPKPIPQPPPPPPYWPPSDIYGEPYDDMFFKNYGVNPFVDTEDDHLSTFAADVDDASYIMMRSYLERGFLPPEDAIRIEEFINHFDYDYRFQEFTPFYTLLEGAPSYFGQNSQLLRIGIKGRELKDWDRKPANLVFVVDVSGSMARENRLELVKESLRYLVDQLDRRDRVGIVTYNTSAREVLSPVAVHNQHEIYRAIDRMYSGGSTNLDHGLNLGYKMAERYFEVGRINRIILCSDGVANVGMTRAEDLLRRIKRFADMGITLTSVGVGMGNHNDALLEQLGDKGNGSYAYVDDIEEAKRLFVEKLDATLQVIARDVKIQVDFDPRVVRSYRLLGYENRDVADAKFRDDREDGGEIGAGHQVTALYEVKFKEKMHKGPIGTVFIRYKDPEGEEVEEIRRPISRRVFKNRFHKASAQFRLAAAAAEFAEVLKKSYWARGSSLSDIYAVAKDVYDDFHTDEVREFMELIRRAQNLEDDLAER